ncbi:helix-turn-helix and ligand-binding sensor domain-containing protein [Polaribacter septentrionalilitoris]|uniref:helix-turn-helix and ligand-binding sensor domain-containing protein n=1 Tax=Polaribacter septentrionalilitoris TaxID=2494657 RepID=UPI00135A527D|nr:triple tyrosine motif-containing protein [Polaribacter septentrionalilitoris]
MKFRLKSYLICFFILLGFSSLAQEFPPINVFYTDDYGAENQNWAISQSEDDFIYVANNKGLLEYNGATWRLFETPNETIMRSVKYHDNKIYTGFYMDFGFCVKDEFGELNYTSIVKQENIEMLEDEQIWNIVEIDGWMIFKSLQRIYLYNLDSKSIKIINAQSRINKLCKVDGIIYFHQNKRGLFKIENGKPKLVSDHSVFQDNFVVDIFSKKGKLFFTTQENGFYFIDNKEVVKWNISSDKLLSNETIYSAKQLKDGSFALGTISNGLIYLNSDGSINYQLDQSSGLTNNTVLSVFEDNKNNIWLGLDNGIGCINNTSPFRMHDKKSDFLGTIYTSIIFKNNLYLGTNQGLFYRNLNSKGVFEFVENTQGQVWNLSKIDGTLFCGHDSGTFIVSEGKARNIFNKQGTWDIIKINDSTIIQGCYDGLYVLKNQKGIWKLAHKIQGFDNSSKYIVQLDSNQFFVNHEYKGVFRLVLDKDLKSVLKVEKEKSIKKGIHSSILKYRDKVLYSNKNGVYVFDKENNTFNRDSLYSKLISQDAFISARLVHNSFNDKLWFFSKDHIKYLSPGKLSNKPNISVIPLSESIPKAASGYENIIHVQNDIYLIGTSNGYIQVDLKSLDGVKDFKIFINKIQTFKTDGPRQNVHLNEKIKLKHNNNNLEFFFSIPNYNKTLTTKYQYQLEGFNKTWSKTIKDHKVLFKNLSHGTYTFKVRGVIGGKQSSNIASYSFKIDRPWYLSNLMITIYILTSLFAFYSVHIASKRYYKKQREDMLDKAKKEAELKDLANTQEIIKLNNDKLRSDIESKNKELATSTMNIIKKNEFLSTIKSELVHGGEKSITKVVKIIDKNLNNTDDWKMFQEAFNNADKKFLKKVKDKHPTLTPNDLRLCAYLRLNLSSKEIAPLLNISPRSVEVKRYRLRKKMNLPHNSNLTNYILEI